MAVAFTRLSCWLWNGKGNERPSPPPQTSSLNASSDLNMRETDSFTFPPAVRTKVCSSSRRVKRKWHTREERRIDREYDLVLVPPDGGCFSGSESDDSDWSIGWLEPHAPDFSSDDEGSFAVLVPCYGHRQADVVENSNNRLLGAIMSGNLHSGPSVDGEKCMEEWLSALHRDVGYHHDW